MAPALSTTKGTGTCSSSQVTGHSGPTGGDGSAGRPQTMAHLDCGGTKARDSCFSGSLLRGTSWSCFCSAVTAERLNCAKDADIWDSAMGTWAPASEGSLSVCVSVGCVGTQAGHPSGHWNPPLPRGFSPSSDSLGWWECD